MSLPARFSEKYFKKYEPHIAAITNSWPKPVDFQIDGSVTTFACRLRDAMRSYWEHKWPSETINRETFDKIYRSPNNKDFIVQEQPDGIVRVCDPNYLISKNSTRIVTKPDDSFTSQGQSNVPVELPNLTIDQIKTICMLAHARLLNAPILLQLTAAQMADLSNAFDILLEQQSDGHYLLT